VDEIVNFYLAITGAFNPWPCGTGDQQSHNGERPAHGDLINAPEEHLQADNASTKAILLPR